MVIFICGFVGSEKQDVRVVNEAMYKATGFKLSRAEVRTGILSFQENAGGELHHDHPSKHLLERPLRVVVRDALSVLGYSSLLRNKLGNVDAWLAGTAEIADERVVKALHDLPAYTSEVVYAGY